MKASVEEISSVKRKISVEIPEDEVVKEVESFYRDLGKKAKIKGFRPGKVPRDILERYFKDYVKAEVIQKLIEESYPKALSETELQPVSPPAIDPGNSWVGNRFNTQRCLKSNPISNWKDTQG